VTLIVVICAITVVVVVAVALTGLWALTRYVFRNDDDAYDVGLEIIDYVPYVAPTVDDANASRDSRR